MAPERFDGHIRSKIYHLETEVPDQLWSKIDQQLRPKKRNQGFIWILLGLLLLATAGVITKSAWSSQDQTDNSSPILAQMETSQVANTSEAEGAKTSNMHNTPKEVDPASPADANLAAVVGEKSRESVTNSISDKTIADESSNPVLAQNLISASAEIDKSQAFSGSRDLAKKSSTAPMQNVVMVPASETKMEIPSPPRKNNLPESAKSRGLYHQLIPLNGKLFEVDPDFKDPLTSNCPSFRAKTLLRPFAELTLGGGVPIRQLTSLNPEGSDYKNLRDRTESVRGVYSARAMVGADISTHFEAKVGVSFTQINEVFDFIDETASRTVVNIITDTIIDSNGNPEVRSDTSVVTEYGQRIKLTNNYYRFLDIPAMVGYRFKVKNHGFILQAGASLNLVFWKEADLLAPDGSIVNVDSGNSNAYPAFKTKAGIDLLGGIGYSLDITERNTLRIIASVQHPLSSLTIAEYPLQQKYTQVKLGVSWKHYLW